MPVCAESRTCPGRALPRRQPFATGEADRRLRLPPLSRTRTGQNLGLCLTFLHSKEPPGRADPTAGSSVTLRLLDRAAPPPRGDDHNAKGPSVAFLGAGVLRSRQSFRACGLPPLPRIEVTASGAEPAPERLSEFADELAMAAARKMSRTLPRHLGTTSAVPNPCPNARKPFSAKSRRKSATRCGFACT
jgi:hypothetical protein